MPSLSFHFPLPLLLLLFCTFLFFSSAMHSFHDDRQSLLAFKKLITSDPHDAMADWNDTNIPISNWTGVTCSRRHPNRVLALNLTSMDLYGPISPFLGNLSFLRSLHLSGNALHGLIPTQLGRLSRLRTLRLSHNQLEGNIASQLSGCRNLVRLALSFNNLSGNIPRELGSLTHLQYLALGTNRLTGKMSHVVTDTRLIPSEAYKEAAKEAIYYSYTRGVNGFSAPLEEEHAFSLANPQVLSVFPNRARNLRLEVGAGKSENVQVSPRSLWRNG